jgi:hypothetical protein
MDDKFNFSTVIVTGADAYHFSNLKILIGSWIKNNPAIPLCVCDFGLSPQQIELLTTIRGIYYLPNKGLPFTHPWEGKAAINQFLKEYPHTYEVLVWIDADALFNAPYPDLPELMNGYDMIIDPHINSIGDIMHECNRVILKVNKDDCYFSAGCWIARKGVLIDTYHHLTQLVKGTGNLWECDAFVASIYHEKLKIRTVNGGIWHSRGKTSLSTCEVKAGKVYHQGQLVYVLHANAYYQVQEDGRRILNRLDLAEIQNNYLIFYNDFLQKNLIF